MNQTNQSKKNQPPPTSRTNQAAFQVMYTVPMKVNGFIRSRKTAVFRLITLFLLVPLLVGCAEGSAVPQNICDAYNNSLYTIRLLGGASMILGLAFLGFKKQISTILPSQGAQTGAVASSIAVGVILLALTTDIGGQIFQTFGLPNIITQC